ncbi:arginine deiminase family protein [Halobacillus shinanisalinarum]|uniref:Arginine deiminase family protein n=1 Tax=Halobacillus shinanisalinarum TaxID=2932258 RepID=A0ABY4GV17_9BACI|nr:arginine deiminase family protein [Halobacillus shinanisalinarum]UOQ91879.1 arginine deiminase family protein [Halobacillus shinanisalinarum]
MKEVKVQGERWFPSTTPFSEEMKELWGDWYCDSEIGKLRDVIMRKPGKEIKFITENNFGDFRWKAPMDFTKAKQQHNELTDIYRNHGVNVHYVEQQREDRPNALFMRDQVFMTPEGAIVCRNGISARRGEERYTAEALAKLGVPIVKTINGDGWFDGACGMWIDRNTVILGTGARANKEGVAQVESELRNMGVTDIIHFQIPYGHAHLDGLINIADKKTAVLFPWQIPYDVVKQLLNLGFNIVEVTNFEELKKGSCINFVALEPGKIVMPSGNPETKEKIVNAGVKVIEADMNEILKGWGAIHCMTAFLKRDPIGAL